MAEKGRALLYRRGDGEGLLATVGANGTPRIHPLNVGVKDGRLLVFVQGHSAKARDLEANAHYALHAHVDPAVPHEFMVRGEARLVTDAAVRQAAADGLVLHGPGTRIRSTNCSSSMLCLASGTAPTTGRRAIGPGGAIANMGAHMEPAAVADDLNEVSVLVNVAHRLLLSVLDDVEASPSLQAILDDVNAAHEGLDLVLERIGAAIDRADAEAGGQPREQRPAIH